MPCSRAQCRPNKSFVDPESWTGNLGSPCLNLSGWSAEFYWRGNSIPESGVGPRPGSLTGLIKTGPELSGSVLFTDPQFFSSLSLSSGFRFLLSASAQAPPTLTCSSCLSPGVLHHLLISVSLSSVFWLLIPVPLLSMACLLFDFVSDLSFCQTKVLFIIKSFVFPRVPRCICWAFSEPQAHL